MGREATEKLRLLLFAMPLLLYAYPGMALFLAHSQTPVYFSRYSQSLLLLNLANLLILVASFLFLGRRGFFLGQSCLLAYCAMSFVFVGNSYVASLPLIELILPLTRLSSAVAISILAFIRVQYEGGSRTTPFFALAVILLGLTFCDAMVYAVVQLKGAKGDILHGSFRDQYDLTAVGDEDVLFVGDSFVWGAGVSKEERFCARAQFHWASNGDRKNVYCLGHVGANLHGYARILNSIPLEVRSGSTYIFYYHNDFPAIDTVWERFTRFFEGLSRSSKSFLLVRDYFVKAVRLDVHEYQRFLVNNYDQSGAHFSFRWRMFVKLLRDVYAQAERVTQGRVYLVILPLAMSFDSYPLTEADEAIREAASAIGYTVLNPISFLIDNGIVNGDVYRAGPNDNHYNAKLNDAIARYLVSGSTSSSRPQENPLLHSGSYTDRQPEVMAEGPPLGHGS